MSGRLLNREVKTLASSSLSASYQNLGSVTAIPAFKLCFLNPSDVDVLITDGTSQDPYYLPSGSTLSIGEGFQQNPPNMNIQATEKVGTQFQIKSASGSAGTTGTVVLYVFGTGE